MTTATVTAQNLALALSGGKCLGTIKCLQPFTQLWTSALDLNGKRALRRRTRICAQWENHPKALGQSLSQCRFGGRELCLRSFQQTIDCGFGDNQPVRARV